MDLQAFCRAYERSASRVLRWIADGNDNLQLVRYADFTRDPEREFRNICSFLDEPFDRGAVAEPKPGPDPVAGRRPPVG